MNNIEKQFGLFDNNLEKHSPELKKAFLSVLKSDRVEEILDSQRRFKENQNEDVEKIGRLFIVEVIGELNRVEGKDYFKAPDYEEVFYPRVCSEIREMLDTMGILHNLEEREDRKEFPENKDINLVELSEDLESSREGLSDDADNRQKREDFGIGRSLPNADRD